MSGWVHGPDARVAVPATEDASRINWISLRAALPHRWAAVFPEELPDWKSLT